MKESLLKLTKMLAEDEKFLKEFSSKKSVDEQYDFAQKSVSGYTKQEFVDFLDELEKSYELKSDISPEEMEKVSGGADVRTKAAAMAMLALSAVGSVAPMLTGAMKPAVPRGGAHPFFAANDDDDDFEIEPIVVQPSTIGGPAVNVGTSDVMRANQGDISVIYGQLENSQLGMFDSAEASKDSGRARIDQVARMKKLASHIETKSAMLNMIMRTYASEKDMGINWVHCPGKTWTGYKMEDTPQIRAKLGTGHEGRIINWLLDQFKAGCYLCFENKEDFVLYNNTTGEKTNLISDISAYAGKITKPGEKQIDQSFIRNFVTKLKQRLNRARVFGQSLKAAGMNVEGQWVMRDEKTKEQPDATVQLREVMRFLNKENRLFENLTFTRCSTGGDWRDHLIRHVKEIANDAVSKTTFTENLFKFVDSSDVNWEKIGVGTFSRSAWKFKIKDAKKSGLESRAKSGDAYSQVLLWLDARFGQSCYLWPDGDHFVLYNNGNGKFDNLYASSFARYVRSTLRVEPVSDTKYNDAIQNISRTCNLHRALSGALEANGMNVEANAVMAGTAK